MTSTLIQTLLQYKQIMQNQRDSIYKYLSRVLHEAIIKIVPKLSLNLRNTFEK